MTPASPGSSRQGTSESSAIILEDVRSSDFAKFLWVFYNPKYSLYHTSPDDWTIILDLAYRWQFPEVKNLVVRELEKLELPDVTRVSVYHKYGVDRNLLIPRYAALCEREEPLSLKEGMELGMETTLNIARAREYARANRTPSGARSPSVAGLERDEMRGLVRELFDVKSLDGAGDQDESTSTPSGGLAKTQPQRATKPPKEEKAKPPAVKVQTEPPTGKPTPQQETLQLNPPPTGAQQKGRRAEQNKKQTGQQGASTPTKTTPTIDPLRQQGEAPAVARSADPGAGTVAGHELPGAQGEGKVDESKRGAGDKEVNGKPEQASGSVKDTTTTAGAAASDSVLVDISMGGDNKDGKANGAAQAGNIGQQS